MMGKVTLALCAAALVSGPAIASRPTGKGEDPNKIVCRTISETGSRLRKTRACHTVAEWAELRRQAKQTVERIQDSRPANLSN